MTTSSIPPSQNQPLAQSQLPSSKVLFVIVGLLLVFQWANIFVLGAMAQKSGTGSLFLQLAFMAVRIFCIVGGAYSFSRWTRLSRFQVMAWMMILEMISHMGFKSLWVFGDRQTNPAAWSGIEWQGILFGLASSFVFFSPLIILLAQLGVWLAKKPLFKAI